MYEQPPRAFDPDERHTITCTNPARAFTSWRGQEFFAWVAVDHLLFDQGFTFAPCGFSSLEAALHDRCIEIEPNERSQHAEHSNLRITHERYSRS